MINQITLDLFPSNKLFNKNSKIKLFEAFAGIGSQHQALKNLGIDVEVVGISEIDKYSIESYEAIHGNVKNYGSITDIKGEEMPKDIDIFTYSFPCQDLSVAGNGAGIKKGTRSGLLYEVERILKGMDSKPKVLLLENVKNLVGKNHKESFDVWLKELENMGYENNYQILNSKHYGVPQNRERVFVISILGGGNYNFPKPIVLKYKLKDFLETSPTIIPFPKCIKRELKNINNKKNIESVLENKSIKLPNTFSADSFIQSENNNARTLRATGSGEKIYLHPKPSVQKNIDNQLEKILNSKKEIQALDCTSGWQDNQVGITISPTLRAGNPHTLMLNDELVIRKLTPKECWRLMGFKDDQFNKAQAVGISNSQLYKQAGNSIVVDVLEAIFKELL